MTTTYAAPVSELATSEAWLSLKAAVAEVREHQAADGSIPDAGQHAARPRSIETIVAGVEALSPSSRTTRRTTRPSSTTCAAGRPRASAPPTSSTRSSRSTRWRQRVDGLEHLVLFPMSPRTAAPSASSRPCSLSVFWPEWVASSRPGEYRNDKFVPVAFPDFTAGYDTTARCCSPRPSPCARCPTFTWGAIFCDREAARFRRVDRMRPSSTHARAAGRRRAPARRPARRAGDLRALGPHPRPRPHARRPAVRPVHDQAAHALLPVRPRGAALRPHRVPRRRSQLRDSEGVARRAPRAVRRASSTAPALPGHAASRMRNYDSVGGQLLFAALRREGVLHWSDTTLTIDWDRVAVVADAAARRGSRTSTGRASTATRRATGRPRTTSSPTYVEPHVASTLGERARRAGPAGDHEGATTTAVLPDEFPLSMFFEILAKKISPVVESARGIRGMSAPRPRLARRRHRRGRPLGYGDGRARSSRPAPTSSAPTAPERARRARRLARRRRRRASPARSSTCSTPTR